MLLICPKSPHRLNYRYVTLFYGMGAISLLSSFKTIGGIESGPEALWGFKGTQKFFLRQE